MKKTFLLLVAALSFAVHPAWAQRVSSSPAAGGFGLSQSVTDTAPSQESLKGGIAAVVNESIISFSDLRARLALAVLSAGMPNSPEVQKKLLPQVLRGLVDEQLQLQEGKKQNISITSEDVAKAMQRVAEDNRIPGGDMAAFLRSHNIPPSTLQTQIKATLTWNKVIAHEVRPRVDIGDDEVDAVVQRMRANAGKQEYLVSEIFLAIDKPSDEEQVHALAEKLVEQIKGGIVFGAAARQFSQGLGAGNGGDIGWIQIGQLAPEIDKVLPSTNRGDIVGPIRSASGYHILGIREKRTIAVGDVKEMSVKLEQIFRPFSANVEKETLLREANKMRQSISDCSQIKPMLAQSFPLWRHQDLGNVKLDKAPAWLAEKIANVEDGHASDPMATDKGALVVFVCGRDMPENIDRDKIRNAIGTEKMELMARRKMRDLRKSAFIDVRLK